MPCQKSWTGPAEPAQRVAFILFVGERFILDDMSDGGDRAVWDGVADFGVDGHRDGMALGLYYSAFQPWLYGRRAMLTPAPSFCYRLSRHLSAVPIASLRSLRSCGAVSRAEFTTKQLLR